MPIIPSSSGSSGDPATIAEVKEHLNIPSTETTHDDELQRMLDAATLVVEKYVGPVSERTVTATFNGGEPTIFLPFPVVSVTSVSESRNGTPVTLAANEYRFDSDIGAVSRVFGSYDAVFATGSRVVSVTYVAGRSPVPADITLATLELVRHWYQQTQQGGRPSFPNTGALEDETPSPMLGFAIPNRVRELLEPHMLAPKVG